MFKKKYLAVAGLMALAVVISGCGKKNSGDSVVQATPTPTQETAVTATPTPELINMEETTEKNIMGEKTSTASKVTIVNKTGSEVAAIYIRETPSDDSEDDEWGDDLVMVCLHLRTVKMQFTIMRREPLLRHTISVLRILTKKRMSAFSVNFH